MSCLGASRLFNFLYMYKFLYIYYFLGWFWWAQLSLQIFSLAKPVSLGNWIRKYSEDIGSWRTELRIWISSLCYFGEPQDHSGCWLRWNFWGKGQPNVWNLLTYPCNNAVITCHERVRLFFEPATDLVILPVINPWRNLEFNHHWSSWIAGLNVAIV